MSSNALPATLKTKPRQHTGPCICLLYLNFGEMTKSYVPCLGANHPKLRTLFQTPAPTDTEVRRHVWSGQGPALPVIAMIDAAVREVSGRLQTPAQSTGQHVLMRWTVLLWPGNYIGTVGARITKCHLTLRICCRNLTTGVKAAPP